MHSAAVCQATKRVRVEKRAADPVRCLTRLLRCRGAMWKKVALQLGLGETIETGPNLAAAVVAIFREEDQRLRASVLHAEYREAETLGERDVQSGPGWH